MVAGWGKVTLGEIIAAIRGTLISGSRDLIVEGLSTDTRKIKRGDLFLALKGERYDGHDFVRQAIDKGAAGIVFQSDYKIEIPKNVNPALIAVEDTLYALGDLAGWWRQQQRVRVAAITGTAGKSTTKEMTAGVLGIDALTLKNEGNFNNLVGLPLTLLMLKRDQRKAVLEMGMNKPGEIARLTEIADPDVGLITNVGRAHLEGVGDIRGVAKAKIELLEKISPDSHVLLNGDDDLLMEVAKPFQRKVSTYGLESGNHFKAEHIRSFGIEGSSFELHHEGSTFKIRLRVYGIQNVRNALSASAICLTMGTPSDHIITGLNNFKGIQGRFMPTKIPGEAILVDDTYNSNPYALKGALEAMKDLKKEGKRILIGLGEMMELGPETVTAHMEAGGMVAEMGAYFFTAIGEHAKEMIRGAVEKGFPSKRAILVESHKEMAQVLRDVLDAGDLILLKGSRKAGLEKVVNDLKGED